jgi:hypothetical protein
MRLSALLFQNNKFLAFTIIALQFIFAGLYGYKVVDLVFVYYTTLLLSLSFLFLAKFGYYPFRPDGSVPKTAPTVITYILGFAVTAMVLNNFANEGPLLFWYPTKHTYWAAAPWLLLGFVGSKFGVGRIN